MYNKLFTKILDSSIWLEAHHTRLVWITFLAVMDQDGFVALSAIGNVAQRARVTLEEAQEAIAKLELPDEFNPDQENEGRRIERIPGMGWIVLNAGKYRDIIKAETVRANTRERVRAYRARTNPNGNAGVTDSNDSVTTSETEAETEAEEIKPPAADSVSVENSVHNGISPEKRLLEHHEKRVGTITKKSAQTKAIKELLSKFAFEDIIACYDYTVLELQSNGGWRTQVTWQTVLGFIPEWVAAGKKKEPQRKAGSQEDSAGWALDSVNCDKCSNTRRVDAGLAGSSPCPKCCTGAYKAWSKERGR